MDLENFADIRLSDMDFDICICGTGPAGMSLALKLAQFSRKVLLLEAGGEQYTFESQKVYQGTIVGLDYFPTDGSRMRVFGGTSVHWSGWCCQLQEHDFYHRDYVELSGWPMGKKDIDPYFAEAVKILDVAAAENTPDYFHLEKDDHSFRKIDFQFSTPVTRFAEKYAEQIRESKFIHCVLNANLIDIKLNKNLDAVEKLIIANYSNKTLSVKAKYYVLCMGGIENARMLLNANKQIDRGIGNENDLVGRCFMEHPTNTIADVLFNMDNPVIHKLLQMQNLTRSYYIPTREFLDANRILNFDLRFVPNEQIKQSEIPFSERLKRGVCASDTLYALARKFKDHLWCFDAMIRISSEQSPNTSSRLTLGQDRDQFGNRLVELDWRFTEVDKKTMLLAALESGKILARKNLGRVRVRDWVLDPALKLPKTSEDEVGGFHHMGTTRMSENPNQGVVDRNLRLHAVQNLFLGGSSVFPTCGFANPTFTIVQLSLRLAEHLHKKLSPL